MRNKNLHRIISLTLILSLAFPLLVGFSHAMENKKHDSCISLDENHIHSEGSDCSNMHYFLHLKDTPKRTFFEPINKAFQESILGRSKHLYSSINYHFPKERGPPMV